MKTAIAIANAGGASELAKILGVTASAVSQWDETIPVARQYQLRVVRPKWFDRKTGEIIALRPAADSNDAQPVAA